MQRYRKIKIAGRTYSVHRWLMEKHIGRALAKDEHVHHRNGDRFDNRLENLEVLPAKEHIHNHKQILPTAKPCAVCAAPFTPHPTKRRRAKTCSPACANSLRTGRPKASA